MIDLKSYMSREILLVCQYSAIGLGYPPKSCFGREWTFSQIFRNICSMVRKCNYFSQLWNQLWSGKCSLTRCASDLHQTSLPEGQSTRVIYLIFQLKISRAPTVIFNAWPCGAPEGFSVAWCWVAMLILECIHSSKHHSWETSQS